MEDEAAIARKGRVTVGGATPENVPMLQNKIGVSRLDIGLRTKRTDQHIDLTRRLGMWRKNHVELKGLTSSWIVCYIPNDEAPATRADNTRTVFILGLVKPKGDQMRGEGRSERGRSEEQGAWS